MRTWTLPGLDEWWDEYRTAHADDQETPRIGDHVSVTKRCVDTCAQLQNLQAQVVRQVYVSMARLPVRLSLGTAHRLQEGLRSSYESFIAQLAEASNVPPLDARTAGRAADAAARTTWRLISMARSSVSELDERIRLVESLHSAARSYALEAVRKIVAQLEADRRLINAVRDGLLELRTTGHVRQSLHARDPALVRHARQLGQHRAVEDPRGGRAALGTALPREALMIPAKLATDFAHDKSKSEARAP